MKVMMQMSCEICHCLYHHVLRFGIAKLFFPALHGNKVSEQIFQPPTRIQNGFNLYFSKSVPPIPWISDTNRCWDILSWICYVSFLCFTQTFLHTPYGISASADVFFFFSCSFCFSCNALCVTCNFFSGHYLVHGEIWGWTCCICQWNLHLIHDSLRW